MAKKSSSTNRSNNQPSINTPGGRSPHTPYTLKDLVRDTGVSKSTISRVFNNPEKVKSSTLKKVRAKAEEMGYQPSRVARRLQAGRGKAKVIGLIIPDISNPFYAGITRGIEDVALSSGYALIFNNSDEDPDRQRQCVDALRMERVDGMILPPVEEKDEYIRELILKGLTVVCVDRVIQDVQVDTVLSDNKKGAYRAVSHLLKLGHKRVAHIGGIPEISTSKERLAGYKKAHRDFGVTIDPELILEGDSRQVTAERLMGKFLSMKNPPTAVFTGNNLTTLGAYAACNKHGVRIPDDIALVGYDEVPWADALNPPPTVIDQSTYEIGRRAAEVLIARIQDPEKPLINSVVAPKLVVRKSCGADS